MRHLLTHTSGLADHHIAKLDVRKDYSYGELLELASQVPLLFAPSEKWSYSNMDYYMFGFICNEVGGEFYGDQLRKRTFEPIDMHSTIISEFNIVPRRAAGYDWISQLKTMTGCRPA